MSAVHGPRVPHLWRINQGHWTVAQKEPSRDGSEKTNAYDPQCNHTGAGLDVERLAGYEEVPEQRHSEEHQRHKTFAGETECEDIFAVPDEQSQTTMVCRDDEGTPR